MTGCDPFTSIIYILWMIFTTAVFKDEITRLYLELAQNLHEKSVFVVNLFSVSCTYLSRVWEKYFRVFAMSVPDGTGYILWSTRLWYSCKYRTLEPTKQTKSKVAHNEHSML